MMKALTYYRSKLSTVVPEELMPVLSDEPSVAEIQLYISLLRKIYCSLTYQTMPGNEEIIARVLKVYEEVRREGSEDQHFNICHQ